MAHGATSTCVRERRRLGRRLMSGGACGRQLRRPGSWLLARARIFLEREARVGGWAYNRACPPDADSTAHALIFLSEPKPKHIAALARFFQPDGGVRTYAWPPPRHGWGDAHPEVTATALRARPDRPSGP